jgi:hypothetical protein
MNCDCEVRPSPMTCDRCNGEGRVEDDGTVSDA